MSKLIVETGKLRSYGSTLEGYASEFHSITDNMTKIVESLRTSWSGYDASRFINNATKYIENLKVIENELNSNGAIAKKRANGYERRCAEFYDKLRG